MADFLYKTTDYHAPPLEAAVRWDAPQLAIEWSVVDAHLQLSPKDLAASDFAGAHAFD